MEVDKPYLIRRTNEQYGEQMVSCALPWNDWYKWRRQKRSLGVACQSIRPKLSASVDRNCTGRSNFLWQ